MYQAWNINKTKPTSSGTVPHVYEILTLAPVEHTVVLIKPFMVFSSFSFMGSIGTRNLNKVLRKLNQKMKA